MPLLGDPGSGKGTIVRMRAGIAVDSSRLPILVGKTVSELTWLMRSFKRTPAYVARQVGRFQVPLDSLEGMSAWICRPPTKTEGGSGS